MNINRDYLIINDVKKSNIKLDNGSMFFYITDKNTQNIFVNLVINVSNNDLIQKYANIENAEDYTLTMNIVKPDNTYKIIEGKLHDKEKAIFEFNLSEDCCDEIGSYRCELLTKCNINDHEEITTSNKITYKVKSSVLNDLDDIAEAPQYPLVIQLFDKLSDIEQYEEDRRANELARQLAEEQRQTRFNTLDTDMVDRVNAMDSKMDDVENRVSAKEQAVDTLIADTKADIDDYKVAKNQEIDEYKTAKDTEINNAITTQDNKINEFINERNDRITVVENNDVAQNNRLNVLENKDALHESRLDAIEVKNQQQDNRLDIVENKNQQQDNRLTAVEGKNVEQDNRLNEIEAIDVAQNTRLDAIEVKNQQQDDRLLDIEKVNKRQDIDIKCLYGSSQTIDIAKEGNSIYLQNSNNGFVAIDEIKGNTLVNCNKEPDKELILNGNINTSGDNNITITEGVDGGLVDVALEGNTMVNVCDQKDPVAITKSYTVETGNHVALQGEYDGKCRPVVTGNTLVNLAIMRGVYSRVDGSNGANSLVDLAYGLKPSTVYTRIVNVSKVILGTNSGIAMYDAINSSDGTYMQYNWLNDNGSRIYITTPGIYISKFTTSELGTQNIYQITPGSQAFNGSTGAELEISNLILLEGDYTNKPIPSYFEGLQSSFEDKVVTQEMVDAGEELAENLGKYKVDYKTTGKNKYNKDAMKSEWWIGSDVTKYGDGTNYSILIPVKNNITYKLSYTGTLDRRVYALLDENYDTIKISNIGTDTITNDIDAKYLLWYLNSTGIDSKDYNIQLEEGSTATSYEPYKEYTKTFYLNSPLLKGDTIEQQGNNVVHVHRSELTSYVEGDETSLITDKVNTLHQLATPTYELIEQSNLAIPSYANGHLDLTSAVPVEKVDFLPFSEELTYLYANTQYTVQFVSDKAITADITLGGTSLLAQSIVKGLNRITITTPSELVDNKLIIDGVGANISEVVVTDTDKEFMYFEGVKSVGEGGNLVITSSNSDNSLSNTQQLTHEPLRAVRDVKDRYVLIDGKWYIERNTIEYTLNGNETWSEYYQFTDDEVFACYHIVDEDIVSNSFKCDSFKKIAIVANDNSEGVDTYHVNTTNYVPRLKIKKYKLPTPNIDGLKAWLRQNPITIIARLASPVYEQINYNPLEVYSDTTHITTNSTIPPNIVVKNHGFNCLLKPSTTYTISSNLGLNTVTTPSVLTEDCLRFYDTDTSTVTTMKNVTILEGDYTTGKPIPSHFSGIESAFEQEYNEAVGKYKVKIRVQNEDASKENYIEFYINEPLRGIGDVKDKVYVKDDKVVVERNCGQREYQDGDFGAYLTDKVDTVYQLAEPTYEEVEYNDVKLFIESFKNSTLFYNSNIPVTSTVHYSYSVPIVDTVAQTANVTDQQDSMIIDLATQVAVMEMMLM